MTKGHLKLLVSCLIAPSAAKHGIYKSVNTINESEDNGVNNS